MGADQSLSQGGQGENIIATGLPGLDNHNQDSKTHDEVPSTSSNAQNSKNGTESKSSVLKRQLSKMGSLIVVDPGRQLSTEIQEDQMFIRLQTIPDIVPIIQQKEKISWSMEGEDIRGRLDATPLLNLGLAFQNELQELARSISSRQDELTKQIKQVDRTTEKMVKSFMERQRKFAKHAEHICKINDMSRSLTKCQTALNDCKRTIHLLNDMLPREERLEPFVWSEDIELVELNI